MKIDVDYGLFFQAMKKFTDNQKLSQEEKETLLNALNASLGRLIPTEDEFEEYKRNHRLLESLKPNTKSWDKAFMKCMKFEEKYLY